MGRVGIRDVARAAGVSATTVSHALSGQGKVSAETRSRVARVARDLGYAPNRVATALRRRRTDVLGFVSDEIATTPFAGRIVLGAQDAASAAGMTLMVVNSNRDPGVEAQQVEVLRAQQVDALLYATMFHRRVTVPAFSGPLVLVNAEAGPAVSSIAPDEYRLGVDATRLLLDAGHRRVVHLTIDEPGLGVEGRVAGYRDTMLGAGLPPHVVAVGGPADARAGREALELAVAADPDATAAFVFNDPMAMGAYQTAARLGLRIPQDLSVVGVDDLELIAAQLLPALTTFQLPHYEMGRWAVTRAVRALDGLDTQPEVVSIVCAEVVRESVDVRV
ncbi:LacI family DNA-binding transcriptional regulator [uncultured Amnibacterium sp.]|uniref:LacI family DNA-binding transcriptional regulator n=1 Tax=uncultured Amnibacterium sp. TaxID=1631851 RepID=UPI0035C966AB